MLCSIQFRESMFSRLSVIVRLGHSLIKFIIVWESVAKLADDARRSSDCPTKWTMKEPYLPYLTLVPNLTTSTARFNRMYYVILRKYIRIKCKGLPQLIQQGVEVNALNVICVLINEATRRVQH